MYKAQHEERAINFNTKNLESYKLPFSMSELQDVLHESHTSAAGPDNIHHQMLEHLPDQDPGTVLWFLNVLWISGDFPKVGPMLQDSSFQNRAKIQHLPTATDRSL